MKTDCNVDWVATKPSSFYANRGDDVLPGVAWRSSITYHNHLSPKNTMNSSGGSSTAVNNNEMAPFVAAVLLDDLVGSLIQENYVLRQENVQLRAETLRLTTLATVFQNRRKYRPVQFFKRSTVGGSEEQQDILIYESYTDRELAHRDGIIDFAVDGTIDIMDMLESTIVVDGVSFGVIMDFAEREAFTMGRFGFRTDDKSLYIEFKVVTRPSAVSRPSLVSLEEAIFDIECLRGLQVTHLHGVGHFSSWV